MAVHRDSVVRRGALARGRTGSLLVVLLLAVVAGCSGASGATAGESLPVLSIASSTTTIPPPTTVAATTTSTIAATTTTVEPTTTTAVEAGTVLSVVTTLDPALPPPIDAAAYVVYDVDNKVWLAEQEADTPRPVGSLMKLLNAYVVMQAGDPTHVVTVPRLHLDQSDSVVGLATGERFRREILLRAMLIVSANDAAESLAVDVGGTTEGFVEQMNAAAQQLGLGNTVAANPTGLDADGAQSSARDLVTLATLLMGDPTFRTTVARPNATMHGQVFKATNNLIGSFDGATGVKTGHTTNAGWCIVGSATRDGRSVIVAVLGAPTDEARVDDAAALMEWAFTR
jgi:serine-type D-Ala-D-Ala carboxypeptidase (penicillin-binding protein 5/6)